MPHRRRYGSKRKFKGVVFTYHSQVANLHGGIVGRLIGAGNEVRYRRTPYGFYDIWIRPREKRDE